MLKFEEKLCPFCKRDNSCNVQMPKSCWCMTIKVPLELKELLPKESVMKSCICKTCVLEFKENPELFKKKYSLT